MNYAPNRMSLDESEILWHYTDAPGFKGIVENRNLRATHVEYLNDVSEIKYGKQRQQAAYSTDSNLAEGSEIASFNQLVRFRTSCESKHQITLELEGKPPYCVCFSLARDALSQWRGYGSATGYALGFRARDLSRLGAQLIKVVYLKACDDVPVYGTALAADDGVITLSTQSLAQIKHEGFSEEREVRLVVTNDSSATPKFRPSDLGLTPYLEIPLGQVQPTSVIVGPGAEAGLRRNAARLLLATHGWHEPEVETSAIPFR